MGGSWSHVKFFGGKLSQNSPKPGLIFWSSTYYVCIYIAKSCWLQYYDLSVLSMSVMGFQKNKKVWMGWVGGWGELYPIFFGFLEFFYFAKPLSQGFPCALNI